MPRSVCISDANIWIDLGHAALSASLFRLPFTFCSTDFVLVELHEAVKAQLLTLGLIVREFSDTEVSQLFVLQAANTNISLEDVSCYFLAREDDQILLTGDRRLRAQAAADGVEVHGVLWLLDEMVHHTVITPATAADGLQAMLDNAARLPKVECDRRLADWRKPLTD